MISNRTHTHIDSHIMHIYIYIYTCIFVNKWFGTLSQRVFWRVKKNTIPFIQSLYVTIQEGNAIIMLGTINDTTNTKTPFGVCYCFRFAYYILLLLHKWLNPMWSSELQQDPDTYRLTHMLGTNILVRF